MDIQKLSRQILLSLLVTLFVVSNIVTLTNDRGEQVTSHVATGLIQSKFENDYSCGSKGRYICYNRYFVINNERVSVNLDTFTKWSAGESVVLTTTEAKGYTLWTGAMALIAAIMDICLLATAIIGSGYAINWALCESNSKYFWPYWLNKMFGVKEKRLYKNL